MAIPDSIIARDHTFKIAECLRNSQGERFCSAAFVVTNANREPLAIFLAPDVSIESLKVRLTAPAKRLNEVRKAEGNLDPLSLYIENCCSFGPKLKAIFEAQLGPKTVNIKLDLYHWMRRWDRKCGVGSGLCTRPEHETLPGC